MRFLMSCCLGGDVTDHDSSSSPPLRNRKCELIASATPKPTARAGSLQVQADTSTAWDVCTEQDGTSERGSYSSYVASLTACSSTIATGPVLTAAEAAADSCKASTNSLVPAAHTDNLARETVSLTREDAPKLLFQGGTPFFPVAAQRLLSLRSQVCQMQLLGRGGQAVVLRGVWQLAEVAVKLVVADPVAMPAATLSKLLLEGPLSKRLRAPNVVETYCYSVTRLTQQDLQDCIAADDSCPQGGAHGEVLSCLAGLGDWEAFADNRLLEAMQTQQLQQRLHLRQEMQVQEGAVADGIRSGCSGVDGAAANATRRSIDSLDDFCGGGRCSSAAAVMSYSDALAAVGARPGCYLTQIVMEYCDQGSLAHAIRKGVYGKAAYDRMALFAYLRTLYDISAGMSYLHSNGVIHGDLKPGNVLLRSSRADPRGYQAKVADFGLSQCVAHSGDTGSSGPAEADWSSHPYMAPEHFDGSLVLGSDVWSFGATAHHMWVGAVPHAGLHPLQVCAGVCDGSLRLAAPPGMPPPLWRLLRACMEQKWTRRPSFPQIRGALRILETEFCGC